MVQPRPSSNVSNLESVYALAHLSEYVHTLDSLPLDLSRNFADLRELDAVLSSSMSIIINKITTLTQMIEEGRASKEERLWLLTEIAEEASRLKLGGEDKIRVACQAADNLKSNMLHLKMLAVNVPGFDPATVNRKTAYPHVAARSFMPSMSLETGRRRRVGYSSLLVSAPDPSPQKRKRVQRDDDVDVSHTRSPKKDRTTATDSNSRSRARTKKNDRAASPSDSVVSVTSHPIVQAPQNMSRALNNSGPRTNGLVSNTTNKRARSTANSNHHVPSPQPSEHYTLHGPILPPSGYNGVGANPRRDAFNVPPSSLHPSLPIPYQNAGSSNIGNGSHTQPVPYDIHALPQSLVNPPEWNQPPTQLEGPGMPLARSQPVQPMLPMIPTPVLTTRGDMTEPGEGEGDGDDNKTYCFCERVSYGEMIACDDTQCEREWFHLACIGLTVPPEGRWFCEACLARRNAKRAGRGGKRRSGGGRATGRAS